MKTFRRRLFLEVNEISRFRVFLKNIYDKNRMQKYLDIFYELLLCKMFLKIV